jgi:hypothetical protein
MMGWVRSTALRVVAFSGLASCLSAEQAAPPAPAAPAGAAVSACQVSPIVADLDKSARFTTTWWSSISCPRLPLGRCPGTPILGGVRRHREALRERPIVDHIGDDPW